MDAACIRAHLTAAIEDFGHEDVRSVIMDGARVNKTAMQQLHADNAYAHIAYVHCQVSMLVSCKRDH